jgi:NADH-quinone oxidoreductase subunit L
MTPTGTFLSFLWLIPLFPLATAALMLFVGKRVPKAGVSLLCVGSVGLSFVCAAGAVSELLAADSEHRVFQQVLFEWLTPGPMQMTGGHLVPFVADWGFLLDPLSCVMVLVVTGVGFLIHVYSVGYMAHEGGYYRFFGYMNLFMFAMLTLVLANNMLLMFVGWEGVGLCSYLLIGFYFLKKSASDAGKKAFIVNRIGDAGFILGILLTAVTLGTIRFMSNGLPESESASGIFQVLKAAKDSGTLGVITPTLTVIALLLFIGAMGKSAQIPLYVWLPDAMEGPTPVSALIHAATMVTAGVYMVVRMHAVYQLAPAAMDVRGVHGGGSERHQEGAGVFDDQPAWIYVPGAGRRGIRGGNFSLDDTCVFQGTALPWSGQRDSRDVRGTGHPENGRLVGKDSEDGSDFSDRNPCDLGDFSVRRIFQ